MNDTVEKERKEVWRRQILADEKRFAATLDDVVEGIFRTSEGASPRVLCLAGPTCSGKTTAAKMLKDRFAARGKRLHTVSIDDFYYDVDLLLAKSYGGEIDYDSEETIDLPELQRFVEEIFAEDESHCPIFNFKTGKREGYRPVQSTGEDCFLFEGIQTLYPEIHRILHTLGHGGIGIYIAPMSNVPCGDGFVEPNELRLMRRLVRDYNFRATGPELTFALWKGVRNNEDHHIFPYTGLCTYRIDSAMTYELGVLKPFLARILTEIPENSEHRRKAQRILQRLEGVEEIPHSLILPGTLYTEFI